MSWAFVFPGQGSQAVGMLAELGEAEPVVRETFDEASEGAGTDLWALSQNGPEDALNQTRNTQPALLAAGVAVWRVWRQRGGPPPAMMAGHSLGEYSALVAAGAISLEDGARLVTRRGEFMQDAVPAGTGAMAAILGLEDDQVRTVCEAAGQGEVVSAANLNSPGQVVIAGTTAAVQRAIDEAQAAGARRAIPLPVSVPSHCALMRPAAERLEAELENVALDAPSIPVLHNVDVDRHADGDGMRQALVRQLCQPVRWTEIVQRMAAEGVDTFAECGPGKVLAGLIRRIDRSLGVHALVDGAAIDQAIEKAIEQARGASNS